MNVTTLNMTTLDGGVIIKKGGGGTPPSGGDVLEGEYYLAKPNGRYWKTKFFSFERPNVPQFDISKVSEEQVNTVMYYLLFVASCGYSAIGYDGGSPSSARDTTSFTPIESCVRSSRLYGEMSVRQELSFKIPAAFEECDFKVQETYIEGVVGYMRILMEGGADNMTDDEILAFASDFLMMEQITKEEYDEWKYWNIN